MSRYISTIGIVVNHRDLGESDYLVTIFTEDLGKIIAVAKGVRNIKSQRLGSLQLGNRVKIQLYQKSDRFWISETKTLYQFLNHHKKLTQLNLLFYFLEILNLTVAENQQIDGIYLCLQNFIEAIDDNNFSSLVKEELNLLDILGFGTPPQAQQDYDSKDYVKCQKEIKTFLETVIERPLQSSELFN